MKKYKVEQESYTENKKGTYRSNEQTSRTFDGQCTMLRLELPCDSCGPIWVPWLTSSVGLDPLSRICYSASLWRQLTLFARAAVADLITRNVRERDRDRESLVGTDTNVPFPPHSSFRELAELHSSSALRPSDCMGVWVSLRTQEGYLISETLVLERYMSIYKVTCLESLQFGYFCNTSIIGYLNLVLKTRDERWLASVWDGVDRISCIIKHVWRLKIDGFPRFLLKITDKSRDSFISLVWSGILYESSNCWK